MPATKADIIARLQRDMLLLQGLKPALPGTAMDAGLGMMRHAFPNASFPVGAVHEFYCTHTESETATGGFVAGILHSLMQKGGACIWISSTNNIFPPALKSFGIEPDRIIFVYLQKQKDILWVMEEALKCEGLAGVVAEIKELSFIESRRLQLAVEQSRVTGFVIRHNPKYLNTTACVTRWKITSLPSALEDDVPGVGFPRWDVTLLKVRNGHPGNWQIEWVGSFRHIPKAVAKTVSITTDQQKQTG
jgi:protein ImuA